MPQHHPDPTTPQSFRSPPPQPPALQSRVINNNNKSHPLLDPGDIHINSLVTLTREGYRFHPHFYQSGGRSPACLCNHSRSHREQGAERDSTPGLSCITVLCFVLLWVMHCSPAVSSADWLLNNVHHVYTHAMNMSVHMSL